jgi:hypothetical protein
MKKVSKKVGKKLGKKLSKIGSKKLSKKLSKKVKKLRKIGKKLNKLKKRSFKRRFGNCCGNTGGSINNCNCAGCNESGNNGGNNGNNSGSKGDPINENVLNKLVDDIIKRKEIPEVVNDIPIVEGIPIIEETKKKDVYIETPINIQKDNFFKECRGGNENVNTRLKNYRNEYEDCRDNSCRDKVYRDYVDLYYTQCIGQPEILQNDNLNNNSDQNLTGHSIIYGLNNNFKNENNTTPLLTNNNQFLLEDEKNKKDELLLINDKLHLLELEDINNKEIINKIKLLTHTDKTINFNKNCKDKLLEIFYKIETHKNNREKLEELLKEAKKISEDCEKIQENKTDDKKQKEIKTYEKSDKGGPENEKKWPSVKTNNYFRDGMGLGIGNETVDRKGIIHVFGKKRSNKKQTRKNKKRSNKRKKSRY